MRDFKRLDYHLAGIIIAILIIVLILNYIYVRKF